MCRRRDRKRRYWDVIKRLRLFPALALLPIAGCATRALPSAPPPVTAAEGTSWTPSETVRESREPLLPPRRSLDLDWAPVHRSGCPPSGHATGSLVGAEEAPGSRHELEPPFVCIAVAPPPNRVSNRTTSTWPRER